MMQLIRSLIRLIKCYVLSESMLHIIKGLDERSPRSVQSTPVHRNTLVIHCLFLCKVAIVLPNRLKVMSLDQKLQFGQCHVVCKLVWACDYE